MQRWKFSREFKLEAVKLVREMRGVSVAGSTRLESNSTGLNWKGFTRASFGDSRCRLGWRPARMAKAYSSDLRERVVAGMATGRSCRDVGAVFGRGTEHGGQLVAALPAREQPRGSADGRSRPRFRRCAASLESRAEGATGAPN